MGVAAIRGASPHARAQVRPSELYAHRRGSRSHRRSRRAALPARKCGSGLLVRRQPHWPPTLPCSWARRRLPAIAATTRGTSLRPSPPTRCSPPRCCRWPAHLRRRCITELCRETAGEPMRPHLATSGIVRPGLRAVFALRQWLRTARALLYCRRLILVRRAGRCGKTAARARGARAAALPRLAGPKPVR